MAIASIDMVKTTDLIMQGRITDTLHNEGKPQSPLYNR